MLSIWFRSPIFMIKNITLEKYFNNMPAHIRILRSKMTQNYIGVLYRVSGKKSKKVGVVFPKMTGLP